MDPRDLDARLAEARRITAEAAALARHHFQHLHALEVEAKGRQDFVSAADREVEALLEARLARAFPGEGFLGEEGGRRGGTQAIWVCDPIDGTTNFLRGLPLFGVSLAFVADGRTQLGIIEAPATGETYSARRGGGAFIGDARARVRPCAGMERALVGLGFNLRQDRAAFMSRLERLFDAGAEFRRLGSATMGLASVVAGRLDAFWQLHLSSWDVLAGLILVEEAGGVAFDFLSGDALERGGPVLAAAPEIASELAEILLPRRA